LAEIKEKNIRIVLENNDKIMFADADLIGEWRYVKL
jgi:hypothetical protein